MADQRLIPPGIRDQNIEALNELIDRLGNLDLTSLLIYIIDHVHESALPHLAWQFHIEGWELAKTVEDKRNLIKRAIELHKYKGTLYGIKIACALAGSKVLRVRTPEVKTHLSLSLTDEERQKFYELFPELRITKFAWSGKRFAPYTKQFLNAKLYTYDNLAIERYGHRAYLVKNKTFTPLVSYVRKYVQKEKAAETEVEIRIPHKAEGTFIKAFVSKYLANQNAKERLYTISIPTVYTDHEPITYTETITPSTEPISSKYEILQEKGQAHPKITFISYLTGHTTDLDAEKRIWKRYKLYDPDVLPQRRYAFTFLDEKPIKIPAYYAEILLDVKARILPRFFYKFPIDMPKRELHDSIMLINDFKSVRDKVLLDTKTKRLPTADGTVTAGKNILIGEVINV